MRSSSDFIGKNRQIDCSQALDPQCNGGRRQKILYIVGIGPGGPDYLCKRAIDVLKTVDTVAGYTTYIDLIRPMIGTENIISTPMQKEVQRVEAAVDTALSGRSCAIVSSGDPGIYAMAGLVFEIGRKRNLFLISPFSAPQDPGGKEVLGIEIVPGIPALSSGASLLGAPIAHDFAVISLSDLLTPWELIERRIEAAAQADFVIVFYNPKSKKRAWQLERAQKIILEYRDKKTPVGIVTGAMRSNQEVRVVALEDLHISPVDMQTTVFVGSSTSATYLDFMVTPRGYAQKYDIRHT